MQTTCVMLMFDNSELREYISIINPKNSGTLTHYGAHRRKSECVRHPLRATIGAVPYFMEDFVESS